MADERARPSADYVASTLELGDHPRSSGRSRGNRRARVGCARLVLLGRAVFPGASMACERGPLGVGWCLTPAVGSLLLRCSGGPGLDRQ